MRTKKYNYYLQGFTDWLKVLGYSDITVYGTPRILQEFFNWLEQNDITQLENITAEHTENFINYNKTRANKRREGGISASHINKYIEVITRFNEYLKKVEDFEIPMNVVRLETDIIKERVVLSTEEVKALYQATDETPFGIRDRIKKVRRDTIRC
jgi:integrase/recombinase XerD